MSRFSQTLTHADVQRIREPAAAWALAVLLLTTGTLHFTSPAAVESIVPGFLGRPDLWVAASGVAELACALGLVVRRTRRLAGWACAVLFVVVFPANVTMAVDSLQGRGSVLVAWLRLPLQVPLVLWALYVAGWFSRGGRRTARRRPGSAAG